MPSGAQGRDGLLEGVVSLGFTSTECVSGRLPFPHSYPSTYSGREGGKWSLDLEDIGPTPRGPTTSDSGVHGGDGEGDSEGTCPSVSTSHSPVIRNPRGVTVGVTIIFETQKPRVE